MVTYKGQEYKYLDDGLLECLQGASQGDEKWLDEEVAFRNVVQEKICSEYKRYFEMLKDDADDLISLTQIVETILEIIFRSPKFQEEFTEMKITYGISESYQDFIRRTMIDKINGHTFGAIQYREIG